MSEVRDLSADPAGGDALFGHGGPRPYELALRAQHQRLLLRGVDDDTEVVFDVARFLTPPSHAELRLVKALPGPILDLGCGPGRMLQAAARAGQAALGVDVSREAIAIATARGLDAVHGSLFDAVRGEGSWGSAMLVDGNVGIGGDPARLIERCVQLVRPGGALLIETHQKSHQDRRFTAVLVGEDGEPSGPFPWAEVGSQTLRALAREAGLSVTRVYCISGRAFVRLRTPR